MKFFVLTIVYLEQILIISYTLSKVLYADIENDLIDFKVNILFLVIYIVVFIYLFKKNVYAFWTFFIWSVLKLAFVFCIAIVVSIEYFKSNSNGSIINLNSQSFFGEIFFTLLAVIYWSVEIFLAFKYRYFFIKNKN